MSHLGFAVWNGHFRTWAERKRGKPQFRSLQIYRRWSTWHIPSLRGFLQRFESRLRKYTAIVAVSIPFLSAAENTSGAFSNQHIKVVVEQSCLCIFEPLVLKLPARIFSQKKMISRRNTRDNYSSVYNWFPILTIALSLNLVLVLVLVPTLTLPKPAAVSPGNEIPDSSKTENLNSAETEMPIHQILTKRSPKFDSHRRRSENSEDNFMPIGIIPLEATSNLVDTTNATTTKVPAIEPSVNVTFSNSTTQESKNNKIGDLQLSDDER